MTTKVKICLSLPLRDFSAFEDLASELGCHMEVLKLTPTEGPSNQKPRASHVKHRIQAQDVKDVKAYVAKYGRRSASQIKAALNLPYGESTIYYIMAGKYDKLLKSFATASIPSRNWTKAKPRPSPDPKSKPPNR